METGNDVIADESTALSGWRRRWLMAAEAVLVLVILGLLLAIWMPALVGARPGAMP